MTNSYSYMNENEIDEELRCVVCGQPFREPVSSRQCHHTFCNECIIACLNREQRCPVCRTQSVSDHYQPVRSRALLNQLNRLRVRCDACRAGNIQRGDFPAHIQNCPNWNVGCLAADIRCDWRGMRNQLNNHVTNCPFQRIRPIVDHLQGQINSLKGYLFLVGFCLLAFILVFIFSSPRETKPPQANNFGELFRGLFSK